MFLTSCCGSLLGRLGSLIYFDKSRTDNEFVLGRQTVVRRTRVFDNPHQKLFEVLSPLEEHPGAFIRTVCGRSRLTTFLRLYHLELFVDADTFLDVLVGMTREKIDQIVPYEYQNVRAYFYYLILKARIREHKATHQFSLMTDSSHYSFNFDKILAEIRENTRYGGQLLVFFDYCHGSDDLTLVKVVLMNRLILFESLFEENLRFIIFLLAHYEELGNAVTGKLLIAAISGVKALAERHNKVYKELKLGLTFEDQVLRLTNELLKPLIILAQKLFFLKKKTPEKRRSDLRGILLSIDKYRALRSDHPEFFEKLKELLDAKIDRLYDPPDSPVPEFQHSSTVSPTRNSRGRLSPSVFKEDEVAASARSQRRAGQTFTTKKLSRRELLELNKDEGKSEDTEVEEFDFEAVFRDESRPRIKSSLRHI